MNKHMWRGMYVAVVLLAASNAWGDDSPVRPESIGFSAARLDYIDTFYADKVKQGELAGIVVLVARHGKIAHLSAVGYADIEKKQRMATDSIFRFYSMTKALTSTALMMLYQEGRFQLSDPLSKYIPEFANLRVLRNPDGPLDDTVPLDRPPTIQDAMRHTAGFTHGLATDAFDDQYTKANVFGLDVTLAQMMTKLAQIPLRYQPGTKWVYSVGPDIQARLVEVLSGMPFDQFLEQRLFKPLGMKDAGFWVPPERAKRLATVHWLKNGKLVPLDEAHGHPDGGVILNPWSVNSYTVNHQHKGGSFGVVGTADDYWRFAQAMLNGGELNGVRILGPRIVQYMARDHLGAINIQLPNGALAGYGYGLGFAVVKDPPAMGFVSSDGSFYWSGAAATHFWIDPKEDLVVVAMTQHMGVPAVTSLAGQLHALVYGALTE